MPVPGTNHLYNVDLFQIMDGQLKGGVSYVVATRALDSDTDGDGIPDVIDPDDDNDGLADELDPTPAGKDEELPSGFPLRIRYQSGTVVVSWSGSDCHLQAASSLTTPIAWSDVLGASPVTMPADGLYQFFRLGCP